MANNKDDKTKESNKDDIKVLNNKFKETKEQSHKDNKFFSVSNKDKTPIVKINNITDDSGHILDLEELEKNGVVDFLDIDIKKSNTTPKWEEKAPVVDEDEIINSIPKEIKGEELELGSVDPNESNLGVVLPDTTKENNVKISPSKLQKTAKKSKMNKPHKNKGLIYSTIGIVLFGGILGTAYILNQNNVKEDSVEQTEKNAKKDLEKAIKRNSLTGNMYDNPERDMHIDKTVKNPFSIEFFDTIKLGSLTKDGITEGTPLDDVIKALGDKYKVTNAEQGKKYGYLTQKLTWNTKDIYGQKVLVEMYQAGGKGVFKKVYTYLEVSPKKSEQKRLAKLANSVYDVKPSKRNNDLTTMDVGDIPDGRLSKKFENANLNDFIKLFGNPISIDNSATNATSNEVFYYWRIKDNYFLTVEFVNGTAKYVNDVAPGTIQTN